MGIEAFFAICVIIWLSIFLYALLLHLSQRKISRSAAQLFEMLDSLKERK